MAKFQKFICDGCCQSRDEIVTKMVPDGWRKVTLTVQSGTPTGSQSIGPFDVCSEGCVASATTPSLATLFGSSAIPPSGSATMMPPGTMVPVKK